MAGNGAGTSGMSIPGSGCCRLSQLPVAWAPPSGLRTESSRVSCGANVGVVAGRGVRLDGGGTDMGEVQGRRAVLPGYRIAGLGTRGLAPVSVRRPWFAQQPAERVAARLRLR